MTRLLATLALALLPACNPHPAPSPDPTPTVTPAPTPTPSPAITHIVIVVQENRSVDNLFQGFPGADTVPSGPDGQGGMVNLVPTSLSAPYDMEHKHSDWLAEYAGGGLNGWNNAVCLGTCPQNPALAYVPQSEVQPYWDLATQYVLADEMFQTNQGPSFPAHQYLLSGTSTIRNACVNGICTPTLRASENPNAVSGGNGGCDSKQDTTVQTIDAAGSEAVSVFPCFARSSLITELDAAGLSWHYYQAHGGGGLWNGVDALKPIWSNQAEYAANVVAPSSQFLADVASGYLANVTWITPTPKASDHGRETDGSGPAWVASIVNAVGASPFWESSAIVVVWDDWGGWYDHVAPSLLNSYELGFRVPMLVISPYAKPGYISHTHYEFGGILKFVEETFGLPSMGTTDARATSISDCFNLGAAVRQFRTIKAKLNAAYFEHQPQGNRLPDND